MNKIILGGVLVIIFGYILYQTSGPSNKIYLERPPENYFKSKKFKNFAML